MHAIEDIVGCAEGHLDTIDIGNRKSSCGGRDEAALIDVSAENVARERSLQVGIAKKQLGLADRCLCIDHGSARRIESRLRLFEVRLGNTLRRIKRLRSLKVLIGLGVLRDSLIDL